MPFCRTVIMNDENEILPQGETGEICVRGDQVMAGYYKNPYATRTTIIDGWCHTGDVGFIDDERYLHIIDRKRDMIITGGLNVYPNEIEQVITSLDAVQDCAVIGVPDEDWGEAVKAIIALTERAVVSEKEIIEFCGERIAGYKKPKSVEFWEELPKSPQGKILKRAIRAKYWKDTGRTV